MAAHAAGSDAPSELEERLLPRFAAQQSPHRRRDRARPARRRARRSRARDRRARRAARVACGASTTLVTSAPPGSGRGPRRPAAVRARRTTTRARRARGRARRRRTRRPSDALRGPRPTAAHAARPRCGSAAAFGVEGRSAAAPPAAPTTARRSRPRRRRSPRRCSAALDAANAVPAGAARTRARRGADRADAGAARRGFPGAAASSRCPTRRALRASVRRAMTLLGGDSLAPARGCADGAGPPRRRPPCRVRSAAELLRRRRHAGRSRRRCSSRTHHGDRWLALPFDAARRAGRGRARDRRARPAAPSTSAAPLAGLFCDGWTETIPDARRRPGIAFHHDAPARAIAAGDRCSPSRQRRPTRRGASTRSSTPSPKRTSSRASAAVGPRQLRWLGTAAARALPARLALERHSDRQPRGSRSRIRGANAATAAILGKGLSDATGFKLMAPICRRAPISATVIDPGDPGGCHQRFRPGRASSRCPSRPTSARRCRPASPIRSGCSAASGSSWSSLARTPARRSRCGSRARRRRCRASCRASGRRRGAAGARSTAATRCRLEARVEAEPARDSSAPCGRGRSAAARMLTAADLAGLIDRFADGLSARRPDESSAKVRIARRRTGRNWPADAGIDGRAARRGAAPLRDADGRLTGLPTGAGRLAGCRTAPPCSVPGSRGTTRRSSIPARRCGLGSRPARVRFRRGGARPAARKRVLVRRRLRRRRARLVLVDAARRDSLGARGRPARHRPRIAMRRRCWYRRSSTRASRPTASGSSRTPTVHFGAIDAGPTDLDPVAARGVRPGLRQRLVRRAGAPACRLALSPITLAVRDTFGVVTTGVARAKRDGAPWSLFRGRRARTALFLAADARADRSAGDPDRAGRVASATRWPTWRGASRGASPGASGDGYDRGEESSRRAAQQAGRRAAGRRRSSSTGWRPRCPSTGSRSCRSRRPAALRSAPLSTSAPRASAHRCDGCGAACEPRSASSAAARLRIAEEEVPREGAVVERASSMRAGSTAARCSGSGGASA